MSKKFLGINLLVFSVYVTFISTRSAVADMGFNIAVGMGVCIPIQVILNVILGIGCFVTGKRDAGTSFLVSAAVLVPVGLCTWLILLSIFG